MCYMWSPQKGGNADITDLTEPINTVSCAEVNKYIRSFVSVEKARLGKGITC